MKAAFVFWNNRIAPVFDTAREFLVIAVEGRQVISQERKELAADLPVQKVMQLVELGVDSLVCGAISRPMYKLVTAYGIEVVPFITGELQEVINAWLHKTITKRTFAMPGCARRNQRRGHKNIGEQYWEKKQMMNRRGQGMGQNRGPGRMGVPFGAGPGGVCVCPKCGHREEHQRGEPCNQKQCPKCGTAIVRQ